MKCHRVAGGICDFSDNFCFGFGGFFADALKKLEEEHRLIRINFFNLKLKINWWRKLGYLKKVSIYNLQYICLLDEQLSVFLSEVLQQCVYWPHVERQK